MLDRPARKAAAVGLAVGALIGVWQVAVDLLKSEDARALRIGGIIFLLLFSALALIWGFWKQKKNGSIRISRGLQLKMRGSFYETLEFYLISTKDLRGKVVRILCNAPIDNSNFTPMYYER